MKKIIISPYSKLMRNGKSNPKNYPFFPELIDLLKKNNCQITQVGTKGEPHLPNIEYAYFDLSLDQLASTLEINDTLI